jgi:hypothetical protein
MFHFEEITCVNVESNNGGSLLAINGLDSLPFSIKRIFLISNTNREEIRGRHAHKKCWQSLLVTQGLVKVTSIKYKTLDKSEIKVNSSSGLFIIPPLTWIEIQILQAHSQILVFASEPYLENDYIRDFNLFQSGVE